MDLHIATLNVLRSLPAEAWRRSCQEANV